MISRSPRTPTIEELRRISADCGFHFDAQELSDYRALMAGAMKVYARIDDLVTPPLTESNYPRTVGYRPDRSENPYNAWYWRCDIAGRQAGPLAGFEVGIKDTICVAGIPMMNGTRMLEGFVPDMDATVVTRLLDAGARVVGKTTTPEFTIAGGPHLSAYGPVLNPRRLTHSSGASSSGSAAAVASGDVKLALGGDQGGSIRYPASWCGIVGLKPTFGLVPYTGCMPIEMTLDHVGPMADTVSNVALMLSVIAGPDGADPRQSMLPHDMRRNYMPAIGGDVRGMRIALLKEGFGQSKWDDLGLPASEETVDRHVEEQVRRLERRGAIVSEVSVPMHYDGVRICVALLVEGMVDLLFRGHGSGSNWEGYYNCSLTRFLASRLQSMPNELPENAKHIWMLGEYLRQEYSGRYYRKAQNLRPSLRAAYDRVLDDHDVLVMPSTPTRAFPLEGDDQDLSEAVSLKGLANQCQFNVTGHPALSVPCGIDDGLPIGAQIVGRRFDDLAVLRVGDALERL